jgi:hypothetical protein
VEKHAETTTVAAGIKLLKEGERLAGFPPASSFLFHPPTAAATTTTPRMAFSLTSSNRQYAGSNPDPLSEKPIEITITELHNKAAGGDVIAKKAFEDAVFMANQNGLVFSGVTPLVQEQIDKASQTLPGIPSVIAECMKNVETAPAIGMMATCISMGLEKTPNDANISEMSGKSGGGFW